MRHYGITMTCLVMMVIPACSARPDQDELRAVLMEADREFGRATAKRGVEGWVSYFAEDGTMYLPAGVMRGRAAIRERMAATFTNPDALTWHPTGAVVAASGDLGYTIGRWESSTPGEDGVTNEKGRGNYVTIWRKQPDGSWKVAIDIGNVDAPIGTAP